MKKLIAMLLIGHLVLTACERVDNGSQEGKKVRIELEDIARLFSEIRMNGEQLEEVFDAVEASGSNGYDEEYRMKELLSSPGAGVGDLKNKAYSKKDYSFPLKEALREAVAANATKGFSVDEYLEALESSDIQIYWPYSGNWDGLSYPVITFAPDDDSDVNVGYLRTGEGVIEEVLVDEELAMERPVWVINRNDDGSCTTIEMLRKEDPDWGTTGGGEIIIGKPSSTKAIRHKMLVLKEFTMLRNFDSWFAGASEFMIKMGSADGFRASTEAELKLYQPSITDLVVVIQRGLVKMPVKYNAVLVSDWTDQIDLCAFLITEDDGGTTTSWNCSIVAKVNSKSYGFEANIPYREKDDIVWRGSLARPFVEAASGSLSHFGDVDLVFELVEY